MSGSSSPHHSASPASDVPDDIASYLNVMETVPGWFYPLDASIFTVVDAFQKARGIAGDLMEIGVYRGKSAILLGMLTRSEERLVVCDIFADTSGVTGENQVETDTYYGGLQRQQFESQYLQFHSELPTILAMDSTVIDREALANSFRMIHVDGSHTYSIVREDIETARRLLGPGGVVILDDWLQPHAPGVQLALWEAFLRGGLIPLCATKFKFYAAWDPNGPSSGELDEWALTNPHVEVSAPHDLAGRMVRIYSPTPSVPQAVPAFLKEHGTELDRARSGTTEPASIGRPAGAGSARMIARKLAPPLAVDVYRRIRRRLKSK